MNTVQTLQINSIKLSDTLEIAMKIGSKLRGGEVIELRGDLGSGKTAFTKGLAKGIGSEDLVNSPSFTISNQYKSDKLTIYHFDFHRLNESGIMSQELSEIIEDKGVVTVIEWADIVDGLLPAERLVIQIRPVAESERELTVTYPEKLRYLIKA